MVDDCTSGFMFHLLSPEYRFHLINGLYLLVPHLASFSLPFKFKFVFDLSSRGGLAGRVSAS